MKKSTIQFVKYLFLVFLILTISSCKNYENIEIKKVTDVEFRGFQNNKVKLNIAILVNNPSYLNIHLKELDMKIYVNNRYLGIINNSESLKIKRRSQDNYTLETELRLANIFTGISMVMELKNNPSVELKMEGVMKIRSSAWQKTFDISETYQMN